MKDKALKERIVAEYLTSGKSYREVADRCGVDYRSLHHWVKEYQGRMKKPHKIRRARLLRELPTDKLPTDVTTLQSELRKARLYNQALQEVILRTIQAYNQLRPHASCDYLTPNQAHQQQGSLKKRWRKYERNNLVNTNQLSKNVNRTLSI